MEKLCAFVDGLKPVMMMVAVQVALTGVNIFYKLAGHNGTSLPVFVSYRFLFAAAFIVPLALFLERKNRPKISLKIGVLAFLSALFGGSLAQNLYSKSLVLTSATFIAAMCNLIPAMTLILAVICRMEALGLRTITGKAKIVGIILGIGGAMILTFYKGVEINIFSTHFDLLQKSQPSHGHGHVHVAAAHHDTSIPGLMTSLACSLSSALGLIFQAKMSHAYPYPYSSTALIAIMGSLQAVVYALCVERDWSQWKLGWNLQLLGYAYTGIMGSGLMWVFIMATVRMRGPLFVSVFSPLLLVLVAIAGSLLLNEKLHLGSVLGGVIIVCGLYIVLWAKSKEMKKLARLVPTNAAIEENASERFKAFNHGSNVVVVAPSCVTESGLIQMCDDGEDEEEEDLEARVSTWKSQP